MSWSRFGEAGILYTFMGLLIIGGIVYGMIKGMDPYGTYDEYVYRAIVTCPDGSVDTTWYRLIGRNPRQRGQTTPETKIQARFLRAIPKDIKAMTMDLEEVHPGCNILLEEMVVDWEK